METPQEFLGLGKLSFLFSKAPLLHFRGLIPTIHPQMQFIMLSQPRSWNARLLPVKMPSVGLLHGHQEGRASPQDAPLSEGDPLTVQVVLVFEDWL